MPFTPARALRALCLLFSFTLIFALNARADLVWNAGAGWRIEGGALSGLSGADGRNALDLMNKARNYEEKGSKGSAISAYRKVIKRYPNSVYAPEALFRTAHLYLVRRQYVKAFDSFQMVLQSYPNSPRFKDVIGEQYRIASALLDGAHPRIWGWLPTFANREKGIQCFEFIIYNAPYSDYAPLALMNVARGHLKMRNTEEAIDALDRMINNYPNSILTPDAYLNLAKTHASLVDGPEYDQAATKDAATYYEDFTILYPNEAQVATAAKGVAEMKTILAKSKIVMGDFYFKYRRNYVAARVFYNESITEFPDSPVAETARKRLEQVVIAEEREKPVFDDKGRPIPQKKKKRFWLF